ncbi:MAG: hypothetical protein IJ462_01470 [Clostridia bacterium]|nr:hypothetical protein [Clostridia bacterium]
MKKILALFFSLAFCFMLSGCAKTCDRCSEDYTGAEIEYNFYGRTLYICVPCAEKLELYKQRANTDSSSQQSLAESSQEEVVSKTESVAESTASSVPSENAVSKPATPPATNGEEGKNN